MVIYGYFVLLLPVVTTPTGKLEDLHPAGAACHGPDPVEIPVVLV